MRPLLLVALLCVPPNIAAFGLGARPFLGARPLSPPRAAPSAVSRSVLLCLAAASSALRLMMTHQLRLMWDRKLGLNRR